MVNIQLDSEPLSSIVQNAVRKAISENPQPTGNPETNQLLTIKQPREFLSWPVQSIYSFLWCTAKHCINYYLNGKGKNLRKHRKKSNHKKHKRFPKPGKLLRWLIPLFLALHGMIKYSS